MTILLVVLAFFCGLNMDYVSAVIPLSLAILHTLLIDNK